MYHQEMVFEIIVNRLPDIASTFTDVARTVYTDEAVFEQTAPVFTDPDGDTIVQNFTISPTPPSTMLVYSPGDGRFTFNSIDNSFAEVYTITLHAYDYASTDEEHTSQTFTLTLNENMSPVKDVSVNDVLATAYITSVVSFPNLFNNTEEALTISHTISPNPSFVTIDSAYTTLTVSSATTNTDAGTYQVRITATDNQPGNTPATSQFNVIVAANSPPQINETLPGVGFTAGRNQSIELSQFMFSDPDSEPLYHEGAFTGTAPTITYDNSTRTLLSIALVGSAGNYSFTVVAYDGNPQTSNATQTVRIYS